MLCYSKQAAPAAPTAPAPAPAPAPAAEAAAAAATGVAASARWERSATSVVASAGRSPAPGPGTVQGDSAVDQGCAGRIQTSGTRWSSRTGTSAPSTTETGEDKLD